MPLTSVWAIALLAGSGGPAGELPPLGAVPVQPAPALASVPQDSCNSKLYALFDFWLGDWNVFTRETGALIARSRVEKINGNCAVRETWRPLQGVNGGSLYAPDLITGRWHQYWVDGAGTRVDLEGGPSLGRIVLGGAYGGEPDTVLRVTHIRLDPDSVRHTGELSRDGGLTWETSFDHLYLRAGRAD